MSKYKRQYKLEGELLTDENYPNKPGLIAKDYGITCEDRSYPNDKLYHLYDSLAVTYGFGKESVPPTILAAALADVNLRTRGLIGLVLGSSAKRLFNPGKNLLAANKPSDLDVLILAGRPDNYPFPQEWGIDWFVKSGNSDTAPTNGLTRMWYDIDLKVDTYSKQEERPRSLALAEDDHSYFELNSNAIGETISGKRLELEDKVLGAGLYLPPRKLMKEVAGYANAESGKRKVGAAEMMNILKNLSGSELRLRAYKKLILRLGKEGARKNSTAITNAHTKQAFLEVMSESFEYLERMGLARPTSHNDAVEALRPQFFVIGTRLYEMCNNLAEIFERMLIGLIYEEEDEKRDYSYLMYPPRVRGKSALYPVLDSDLLEFRAMR